MRTHKAGKDFSKHFPYIETVIFSDGGFSSGYVKTTVHFSDGQAVFDAANDLWPDKAPIHYEGMTKAEFLAKLQSLHIEEWYKKYVDPRVLDGEQWHLKIHFNDGHRTLIIDGDNAFPPNFKDLQQLMSYGRHED